MRKNKIELDAVARFNRVSMPTNVLLSTLFIVLAVICVIPVVFVAIISFSSNESIQQVGYSFIPNSWSFDSYEYLWRERKSIGQSIFVSIGVTIVGTLTGLFLTATMGYVISRPTFKLKRFFTTLIFIPMLFGTAITYIAYFLFWY